MSKDRCPDVPKLLILHVRHVIIVCILKRFRDSAVISLLILAGADEAVEECKDYAHRGRDHLDSQLATARIELPARSCTHSHDPASRIQRFLFLEEDQGTDEVTWDC